MYELSDQSHPDNYFQRVLENHFACEPDLTRMSLRPLEGALEHLDNAAWNELKKKAMPFVTRRERRRQWGQLFNYLYEAFGYEWLVRNGYTTIQFIDRRDKESKQTPELLGKSMTSTALLEVKTINNSDADIAAREQRPPPAINLAAPLAEGFRSKFAKDVAGAEKQLMSFEEPVDRKIILVVVNLDCRYWLNSPVYQEIETMAANLSTGGLEVVVRHMVT